jgi:hypothetical protein
MPRRSRKTENSASALPAEPVTALKPKRKAAVRKRPRAAAGQRGSARKSSRRDPAPAPAQLLFLPTRPRCLFLTYAGPAQPRHAATVKGAIDLPSVIILPYLPLDPTYERAAQQERISTVAGGPPLSRDPHAAVTAIGTGSVALAASAREVAQSLRRPFFMLADRVNPVDPSAAMITAVAGIAAVASPALAQTRSLHRRLPLGGVWRWAKARAAAAPRSIMRSLRTRVLLSVPHLFTIDPHTTAVVAVWSGLISGALVTGVLMHARTQLLETEALSARQTPQPAHQPNAAIQNRASNKKKDSRPAQDGVVIENWIEPGKTIQAQQPGSAVADVRIIDGPARMKGSCYEQTWPYIAARCLSVAEDSAAVAAGHPIAVIVTPLPSLAARDASTADPAQPAPSVPHAAEARESEAADNEVTGNTDRRRGSARRFKASMHRAVASASVDDSSPMPEKSKAVRMRHAQRDLEPRRDRPQRDRLQSVAHSQPVRENNVISGPPPYLSFNAY